LICAKIASVANHDRANRYTKRTVKKSSLCIVILLFGVTLSLADETSFLTIRIPHSRGKQIKATLTFSDNDKAVEVHPSNGAAVRIPYSQIDKCSYEFTKKHRVSEGTIALAATTGVGAVVLFTRGKSHWLEIDYHDQQRRKAILLQMDKHDYIHVLDALKAHTGIDAEVLGNADKRRK
jgi:hypothetical protein